MFTSSARRQSLSIRRQARFNLACQSLDLTERGRTHIGAFAPALGTVSDGLVIKFDLGDGTRYAAFFQPGLSTEGIEDLISERFGDDWTFANL